MVTYVDTQAGGVNNDLTQGGTFEWSLNLGTEFYLNVANNLIPGQGSGQNVTFKVQDIRGSETFTVLYGRSISQHVKGHLVTTMPATLPVSPNADLHIVLSDSPQDLSVQQQQLSTSTGAGSTQQNVPLPNLSPKVNDIYTVPTTNKGFLQSCSFFNGSGGNAAVTIRINRGGTGVAFDYITTQTSPPTVAAGGSWFFGQGPGNTGSQAQGVSLGPGDILEYAYGQTGGPPAAGTASFSIRLEPL